MMLLSPKQQEAIRWISSPETFLFLVGSVRSGKSFCLDLAWLLWTQGQFNTPQDFIMAGHSSSSIKRNIFPDMSSLAAKLGMSWKYVHFGSYVQCGMHKYHVFGSIDKDSADGVRGMTAAGTYFDEMVLMDPTFIDMCITRMSVPKSKLFASMNPSYPAHFVKEQFVDRAKALNGTAIQFGLPDNPSLTDGYKQMLKRTLVGAEYQRLVLGQWVATAGLVYPKINTVEANFQADYRRNIIAIDYSTSGIASFLLIKKKGGHNPKAYVCEEFYHDAAAEGESSQKSDVELVDAMEAFVAVNGLFKQNVYILPDPSAASFRRELQKRGWEVRKANNDILEGIRVTNASIALKLLYISKKCKRLLKEINTYQWDNNASQKGEDKPVKTNQHHGVDALRYFTMKEFSWALYQDQPIAKPAGY